MKKVAAKKLTLSRETLLALKDAELRVADGGLTLGTCYNSCPGTTCGTRYC